ncbi:hypothetical protein JL720_16299 [Aureococcus anophagefferens]|nr:hypothetical protein JL720_16299 [Aureococcus anophagefferens]
MRAWTLLSLACAAALAPPQAARRRSSRLRAAAPNDDPGPSDAALLDVALSRHLHAGIWAATFDGGEENRIALDAEGRASAVRDLWTAAAAARRPGLWRIETVDGEPTACAVTVVLGSASSRRGPGDAPAPDRAGFVIYGDIPDMGTRLIGAFELTPAAALPPSLLGRLPIPSAWGSSLT